LELSYIGLGALDVATPWILAKARCGLRFDHQTRQLEMRRK
jgi:hypothetical protein